jgi:hypothetical protein
MGSVCMYTMVQIGVVVGVGVPYTHSMGTTTDSKVCRRCGVDLPLAQYYPHSYTRDGKYHICIGCHEASKPTPPIEGPSIEGVSTEGPSIEPDPTEGPNLGNGTLKGRIKKLRKYGIGIREFVELWTSQNGVCAICGSELDDDVQVDHCHESGLVRGLLCRHCNIGLGQFKDNPERLRNAILYLEKH